MKTLYLDYDHDCDGPEDWDLSWKLYSFHRHSNGTREFKERYGSFDNIGLRAKLKAGTAFVVSCYDHSGQYWSHYGEGPTWDRQWDYAYVAGLLAFEHDPKEMAAKTYEGRKKDAQSFLDEYNDWINGNCYGYQLGENCLACSQDIDSCWGFIGRDALQDALNEILDKDDEIAVTGPAAWLADYMDLKATTIKAA